MLKSTLARKRNLVNILFSSHNKTVALKKSDYKARVLRLRADLQHLQRRVTEQDKPVIIVIAGDDRSGRHETINTLASWMDPRFLTVNAYGPSQHEDEAHPFFWRFWRDLPGAGEIAIYLRDWTSTSIVQFLNGEITEDKLRKRETYIQNFENKHMDEGALIIKCWLHIDEPVLRQRVDDIRDTPYFDVKDELALKHYPNAMLAIEKTLNATSSQRNAWHIVDGTHAKTRNVEVANIIKEKLSDWLDGTVQPANAPRITERLTTKSIEIPPEPRDRRPDKSKSKAELKALQTTLRKLMFKIREQGIPVVLAFEGWDAAGKGGAIRRLVQPLDAGFYRIKPIAKPNEEENAHHYLWRFWRNIPRNGQMMIFDRTWYGRVLVERVEGFATQEQWQRAYQEINDFEEQLTIHNAVVMKFWLNISKDEQLKRFQERERTAHKRYKITEEDYRNRDKWDHYVVAVGDMVDKTHKPAAPWVLINTDFKDRARLEVLHAVVTKLEQKLASLG